MQNLTLTTHNQPPSRMKSLQSLLLPSLVAVSLSSCMVYDYPGGYYGGPVAPPVAVSVGTYEPVEKHPLTSFSNRLEAMLC